MLWGLFLFARGYNFGAPDPLFLYSTPASEQLTLFNMGTS